MDGMTSKFKTKIVQRFDNGFEYFELLLPDGRSVASGSLSHCWDEREHWEEVLKSEQKPPRKAKCRQCLHLDYDHLSDTIEPCKDGEHFCGLHGRARIDPDGIQQDLNHQGGCGFIQRNKPVQLELSFS